MLKRKLTAPAQFQSLDSSSPFLKAHMSDGRVYILSSWKVDSENQTVTGQGEVLNANREILETGELTILINSVAIFETNTQHIPPEVQVRSAVLITTAALGSALAIYCASHPKACFGSCPTFYVSDGNQLALQAEGFSASVAPSLEASDVDALYHARPIESRFKIQMKNEALETHVVRHVDLLAVKRQSGGRVFQTADSTFWETDTIVVPSAASAPEGDCLTLLQSIDGQERFSEADSEYLATRETLDLEFKNVPVGNVGLVIAARQSLMSTFLFYQGLAYMGRYAGQWIAALERGDPNLEKAVTGIGQTLGGIEVLLQDHTGKWVSIGEVKETGPLATDVHLVKLPAIKRERVNIRLRLTTGHWRLDAVQLVKLGKQLNPVRLSPVAVNQDGVSADEAHRLLTDPTKTLTTLPGDVYTLVYQLPKDFESYELFLESRGYYLEWIREEWLADENPALAGMMLFNPERALRVLAPEFKKVEVDMEEKFWGSRYEKPQ
ncbi:MAG: hypothetical protein OXU23_25795 [Candidatus Poribacteria bacterium]|nr:hypothetical protein [Candidatus Poribacteria bacterium]MDE0468631.1 hypothetical protein [Candidatus Poribacteria bacterium]